MAIRQKHNFSIGGFCTVAVFSGDSFYKKFSFLHDISKMFAYMHYRNTSKVDSSFAGERSYRHQTYIFCKNVKSLHQTKNYKRFVIICTADI